MRTIIRFSVNGDTNSALRNTLANRLKRSGFKLAPNTATWEHADAGERRLPRVLLDFWAFASSHKGPGTLDHFWMYSDQKPPKL